MHKSANLQKSADKCINWASSVVTSAQKANSSNSIINK